MLVACLATACPRPVAVAVVDAGVCVCEAAPVTVSRLPPAPVHPEPARPRDVHPLAVCETRGKDPLVAAQAFADAQDWDKALSCAAQASALNPDEALAHVERARALVALERLDEAKLAYARALALDPGSLDALLGAAHLYAAVLPSSKDVDDLGSLYAERGFSLASEGTDARAADEPMALELARVSAMAFNDLGRSSEAIARADWVLARVKHDPEASFERAVALFERCDFEDARAAFAKLVSDPGHAAHAHYHLALLLERDGKLAEAEKHFVKAQALLPDQFWKPVLLPSEEFEREVKALIEALEPEVKRDLAGVPVAVEELPDVADLTTGDPPLSPTILGLFRGPPLQEACLPEDGTPCRSIALYRKNLGRAVKTRDELLEQLKVTLLHEIGHLRGEDDGELAARGLE